MPFLFIWALLIRYLGLRFLGARMWQAGHDLAYRNSLLLHKRSYSGSLRFLLGSLKMVWQREEHLFDFGERNGVAVYDGTDRSVEIRREYTSRFLGHTPDFLVLGIFPPLRARILSYGSELGQAYNLNVLLKRRQIKTLYYFCIFDKDSNFTGLLLMKSGSTVNKFSSETPLGCHNHAIVADQIIFCHPYQLDEWKKFRSGMFARSYRLRVPEQTFLHLDQYKDHPPAKEQTLAIYTAGGWYRKQRGDVDQGFGYYYASGKFFEYLNAYLAARPHLNIRLYMHPVERGTPERFAEARAFYESTLNTDRIEYGEKGVRTAATFTEAEVGVAVFAAVIWDRLLCGYKGVYAPGGEVEKCYPSCIFTRIRESKHGSSIIKTICWAGRNRRGYRSIAVRSPRLGAGDRRF